MKAVVQELASEPMVIKDVPDPSPQPGEVLIQVKATGVCHTDLHIADGDLAMFGYAPYPIIMGHEIVGVVEETGEGATADLGERYFVDGWVRYLRFMR